MSQYSIPSPTISQKERTMNHAIMKILGLTIWLLMLLVAGQALADPGNIALARCGTTIEASDSESGGSVEDAAANAPQNLIDGILNPATTKRWHSDTGRPHPHWLWLHFSQPFKLNRVVLYAADQNCFPMKVKLSYRDKNSNWQELVSLDLTPAASVPISFPATLADNLRIEILESSSRIAGNHAFTQLNEVEVYAEMGATEYESLLTRQKALAEAKENERAARHIKIRGIKDVDTLNKEKSQWPEKNIALAKCGTRIEASTKSGDASPEHLIDGLIDYGWKNAWRSDNSAPHPHDLLLQFARPFKINRVVIYTSVLQIYCPTRIALSYQDKDGSWNEIVPPSRLTPALHSVFEFEPMVLNNLRVEILESRGKWHGAENVDELNEIEAYADIGETEYQALTGGK